MNSTGGTLVIGLKDDGEVLGIDRDIETLKNKPDLDGFALAFSQNLGNYLGMDRAAVVELTFAEKDGKTLAVASCPAGTQPVFIQEGSEAEFWVRVGNSSRALNVLEVSQYIKHRWPAPA